VYRIIDLLLLNHLNKLMISLLWPCVLCNIFYLVPFLSSLFSSIVCRMLGAAEHQLSGVLVTLWWWWWWWWWWG